MGPTCCSYAAGVSTIKSVATILSLLDIFNYTSIVNCLGYLQFNLLILCMYYCYNNTRVLMFVRRVYSYILFIR